jgi:hypothetical protein
VHAKRTQLCKKNKAVIETELLTKENHMGLRLKNVAAAAVLSALIGTFAGHNAFAKGGQAAAPAEADVCTGCYSLLAKQIPLSLSGGPAKASAKVVYDFLAVDDQVLKVIIKGYKTGEVFDVYIREPGGRDVFVVTVDVMDKKSGVLVTQKGAILPSIFAQGLAPNSVITIVGKGGEIYFTATLELSAG